MYGNPTCVLLFLTTFIEQWEALTQYTKRRNPVSNYVDSPGAKHIKHNMPVCCFCGTMPIDCARN